MPKTTDIIGGTYCLLIESCKEVIISSGKFKGISFPAGYYYYTGSAQKNLIARIQRHIRKNKPLHWHIDFLTSLNDFTVKEVYIFRDKKKSFECVLSQDLFKIFNLKIIAPGFGSSDCNECQTHLYYSPKKLSYNHFISRYQSIERLIPSSSETV